MLDEPVDIGSQHHGKKAEEHHMEQQGHIQLGVYPQLHILRCGQLLPPKLQARK